MNAQIIADMYKLDTLIEFRHGIPFTAANAYDNALRLFSQLIPNPFTKTIKNLVAYAADYDDAELIDEIVSMSYVQGLLTGQHGSAALDALLAAAKTEILRAMLTARIVADKKRRDHEFFMALASALAMLAQANRACRHSRQPAPLSTNLQGRMVRKLYDMLKNA